MEHHRHKDYNQIAGQKVARTEAIADGVFAIAMTLLILDIRVPIAEGIKTEGDLLAAFCALTPKILTYFMSFMTLGIFWTGHSTQYTYIEKSDRHLGWLSLFILLFVSTIPFTTAFLGEFIHYKIAVGLYWLNILFLGITIYAHWSYAQRHGYLNLKPEEEAEVDRAMRMRVIIAQMLYAFGAALCFINTYLSILVIVAVQMNYAFAFFSKFGSRKKG